LLSLQLKENKDDDAGGDDSDVDSDAEEDAKDADYDYLLGMAMWSLTAEKKEELLKKKDDKHKELDKVSLL
jgi:DNA topoisomerase-2